MNDLVNPHPWLNEKTIQYTQHPAFSAYHLSQSGFENRMMEDCQDLSHEIESLSLETSLSCNRLSLQDAIHKILPKLAKTFTHLNNINKSQIPNVQEFLTSVWQQTIRILVDDLAYFERRNSLNPVVSNQHELNIYRLLEQQGFFTCHIPQEIVHNLHRALQLWMETIQSRADQGINSREELSINQIPREIVQYLNQQFEALGISSAMRSARREHSTLSGFALELSVPHAGWWQSDYQDLAYGTGRSSYFHVDEGRDVYRAILYLSDVPNADLGAAGCLPGSFTMKRDRLPWILSRSLHLAARALYNDIGATGRLTSSPTFRCVATL
ncbi:MAG: hypothetical protein MH825_05025 [Cyanobacteria bacterium]|nr:hypothetical protein [Cyanobacteriota bacterium]